MTNEKGHRTMSDAIELARRVTERYRLHTVVAESLQDDANTLARALLKLQAECERMKREAFDLRSALIQTCDDVFSTWDQRRAVRAIREAANDLSEPFSFAKADRMFAELLSTTKVVP